jgi:acyl-CoA thioester hydrolase
MFRGVVYPWHCDHLGHMTVMHYVGMFDQAAWHLLSALGFTWESMKAGGKSLVDVKHTIEYREEQRVGSLVVIESALTRIGGKSITQYHKMRNTETGALAATSEIVSVYFDLESRTSLEIPDEVRDKLGAFLVQEADA